MKRKIEFSYIFILLLFFLAGMYSWNAYFRIYRQKDTVDISAFPMTVGEWVAQEIPVSDDDKAILETENVFVRRYTNAEGKDVYLFIVYSQYNRKVSHPPEICYTGAGATILANAHDAIKIDAKTVIRTNRVIVERRNAQQMFFYWFKVGDSYTSNYWKQQGLIALKSFLGKPASSALIRISTDMQGDDLDPSAKLVKEFGRLIYPHLEQYLP